jgi:hypothetical protein
LLPIDGQIGTRRGWIDRSRTRDGLRRGAVIVRNVMVERRAAAPRERNQCHALAIVTSRTCGPTRIVV